MPLLAALVATALSTGCGGDDAPSAEAKAAAGAHAEPAGAATAKPKRSEQPLPAFSGWSLDDERVQIAELIGRRLVLFFFDPGAREADVVAQATARVAALRSRHNFEVVGVASGAPREAARAFAERHGVDFPVIDDASRRISQRFGLETPAAVLGADAEGYIVWGFAHFPTQAPDAVSLIEQQLRDSLRIPSDDGTAPGERPMAPTFTARRLDGDEPFDLAAHRGEPVLLLFFLHTCPHCHEALEFLKDALADLPEDKRPLLVGLELTGRTDAVRSTLRKDGLDFFPVIFDEGGAVQAAYGSFAGVPDLVLIDREGRIAGRIQGWRAETDPPLLRMRMAKLAGAPVPMLLRKEGYSGSEVCGICHESEHRTWELTQHARAFDTLVTHGADSDPECVGCHVVGFGEAGGYRISPATRDLEDVGCESCHGRGGPHLSPGFVRDDDYAPACLTCHDPKHSLGFEYASFLPKVSHAENARILALPAAERDRILAERGAPRENLLPTAAAHVGSEACRSCHPSEFATWSGGPHARAVGSLAAQGKSGAAECLRCHTTGFGRPGGFPADAVPAGHADLARVGCESCHGPGADHVADGATKLGTIVSLGDKCDSCVILQICGSCHDDANDPGFEFEVLDKIERIRHGTIEAGTGKPLDPKAGAPQASVPPTGAGLVARAFAAHEAREAAERRAWTR